MSDGTVSELVRLFVLHKAGGLNQEEFTDAKAALFGVGDSADGVAARRGVTKGAGGGLLLYVRVGNGAPLPIEVAVDACAADVQASVAEHTGLAVGQHRLRWQGKELPPSAVLADVGIGAEAEIAVATGTVSFRFAGPPGNTTLPRGRDMSQVFCFDEGNQRVHIHAPTGRSYNVLRSDRWIEWGTGTHAWCVRITGHGTHRSGCVTEAYGAVGSRTEKQQKDSQLDDLSGTYAAANLNGGEETKVSINADTGLLEWYVRNTQKTQERISKGAEAKWDKKPGTCKVSRDEFPLQPVFSCYTGGGGPHTVEIFDECQ